MSRLILLEFSGALYHVTSRGDGRAAIVLPNDDRGGCRFLARSARASKGLSCLKPDDPPEPTTVQMLRPDWKSNWSCRWWRMESRWIT
jgi:hypothetical protein